MPPGFLFRLHHSHNHCPELVHLPSSPTWPLTYARPFSASYSKTRETSHLLPPALLHVTLHMSLHLIPTVHTPSVSTPHHRSQHPNTECVSSPIIATTSLHHNFHHSSPSIPSPHLSLLIIISALAPRGIHHTPSPQHKLRPHLTMYLFTFQSS